MPNRPTTTASDDHMSEEKCSASASSASLDVCLATRLSARARKKSTTTETSITANAQCVASTCGGSVLKSRFAASQMTTPASPNKSAVSASAVTLSTLPWP